MIGYGNRLRLIRENTAPRQKDFAKYIGVSASQMSYLENENRDLNSKLIIKLIDLGINTNWLLTGKGNMYIIDETTKDLDMYTIPVMDVCVSDGDGSVSDQELISYSVQIGEEFKEYWGKDVCALRVSGDSMEPTVDKDGWVLVRQLKEINELEGVYVFLQNKKLRCKRIQRDSRGGVYVISDNPKYENEHYERVEDICVDMRVIGEVVGVLNRV